MSNDKQQKSTHQLKERISRQNMYRHYLDIKIWDPCFFFLFRRRISFSCLLQQIPAKVCQMEYVLTRKLGHAEIRGRSLCLFISYLPMRLSSTAFEFKWLPTCVTKRKLISMFHGYNTIIYYIASDYSSTYSVVSVLLRFQNK